MRISDWSSDVCSSDLPVAGVFDGFHVARGNIAGGADQGEVLHRIVCVDGFVVKIRVAIDGKRRAGPPECGCLRWPNSTAALRARSEEHTSELQSLLRISYAVFCLKKKKMR